MKVFNHLNIRFILVIISISMLKTARGANPSKFKLPERLAMKDVSTMIEYSQLSRKYNTANLGLGAPDFPPPIFVRNALLNVTLNDDFSINPNSPNYGHIKLRIGIAKLYSRLVNRNLNPVKNVIVTVGATEALYMTFQAHTSPGDEWIIIEPAYDPYSSMIRMAGGTPKYIQLKPSKTRGKITSRDWTYDRKEMARTFNKKTKGVLINTPHNPTGKVFTREELQFIANLAIKWNTLVVADEVYEWLIYKPNKHIRIAMLPDMYERTITIGSASKTFSVTGWRVGWVYGPADKLRNLKVVHPMVVDSNPTPNQIAVANVLERFQQDLGRPDSYLAGYLKQLQAKRDELVQVLGAIGMTPVVPEAGYFLLANWTRLEPLAQLQEEHDELRDFRFTKWLAKNVGVLALPGSIFYGEDSKRLGEDYARFCFVKKNQTMEHAEKLLLDWAIKQS